MALLVPTLVSTKLQWYLAPAYPALALCIGFAATELLPRRQHRKAVAVALVILLANFAISGRLRSPDYSPEVKALAPYIHEYVPPEEELCVYRRSWPSVSFYGERRTLHVRSLHDERLARVLERSSFVWCVARRHHLPELRRLEPRVEALTTEHLLLRIPGQAALRGVSVSSPSSPPTPHASGRS
jgi:hypothetical protein